MNATMKTDLELTFVGIANANAKMHKANAEIKKRNRNAEEYIREIAERKENLEIMLAGLCVVATPIALCIIGAMF